MSARQPDPYASIARKWLALAERRRAHLIELRDSGRWQGHLTDAQIDEQLQDLELACARLAEVAGIAATSPDDDVLAEVLTRQLFATLQRRLRA